MASEGPLSPSTIVDDDAVGTRAWSNPGNAGASDFAFASATGVNNATVFSHYLKATNFGFSIPSGATIDGVLVEIQRVANPEPIVGTRELEDSEVKLVVGGSVSGENKAETGIQWTTDFEEIVSYGGESDTHSLSLSAEDVNDPGFGAVLSTRHHSTTAAKVDAFVDHVRITVFYTEAVEGGGFAKRVQRRFRRAGFGGGRAA